MKYNKTRKTWNAFSIKSLQFDNYSEWIDFITLSFWKKSNLRIWQFLLWDSHIDSVNANLWITTLSNTSEIFSILSHWTQIWKAYTFSVTYNNVPIPVFQYVVTNDNTRERFHTYGKITFYWSYFRLVDLHFFDDDFIYLISEKFKDTYFSRIDYRFDFFDTRKRKMPGVSDVLPWLRKDKKIRIHWKTGKEIESFDIWVKKYQTIFIRYYDKLIELSKNLKWTFLYGDIIQKYKTFHRLEYEFWQKYCWAYSFGELEELKEKIFKTVWKPSKFSGYMYKPKIVIDLSDEIVKNRYVHNFQAMASRLIDNWINPYNLIDLLDNDKNIFKK